MRIPARSHALEFRHEVKRQTKIGNGLSRRPPPSVIHWNNLICDRFTNFWVIQSNLRPIIAQMVVELLVSRVDVPSLTCQCVPRPATRRREYSYSSEPPRNRRRCFTESSEHRVPFSTLETVCRLHSSSYFSARFCRPVEQP